MSINDTPTDEDVARAVTLDDYFLAIELLREQVEALVSKRVEAVAASLREDSCTLRVQANHRDIVESEDVVPGPGLETLTVADDLGRKLQVEAMAWGCGHDLARGLFQATGDRPCGTPEAFTSLAPLDAAKTYLVVVVEHPDEAIRG